MVLPSSVALGEKIYPSGGSTRYCQPRNREPRDKQCRCSEPFICLRDIDTEPHSNGMKAEHQGCTPKLPLMIKHTPRHIYAERTSFSHECAANTSLVYPPCCFPDLLLVCFDVGSLCGRQRSLSFSKSIRLPIKNPSFSGIPYTTQLSSCPSNIC